MSYLLAAGGLLLLGLGKKYFNGGVCKITKDLTDKVIVITGASSGLGRETAKILASMKGKIVLACRNEEKTMPIIRQMQEESSNKHIYFMKLDLEDLESIRNFAETFKKKFDKIDILINNAGLACSQNIRETNKEGFEKTFMTNYLGHFYLTHLLLDCLKAAPNARIISVSSLIYIQGELKWDDLNYEKRFNRIQAYSDAKMAQIMFSKEFDRRFKSTGIKAVSLHPGVVRTEPNHDYLGKSLPGKIIAKLLYPIWWYFTKSPNQGVQTILYCALLDYDQLKAGEYYGDCQVIKVTNRFINPENNKKLWDISVELLKSKGCEL
jgi:Dehydrogenases with different specificities (related to short-chain alcohol dehydrogenases)